MIFDIFNNKKVNDLESEVQILNKENKEQSKKINNLESELDRIASDGLRHGSSEGGRRLSNRRRNR